MGQGLLHLDALVGVEGEHALEEIEGVGVRVRVQPRPRDLWLEGKALQVVASLEETKI